MAIRHLQQKSGVKADGQFGPATLAAAASHFKLTPQQAAHFFAQCDHETGGFKQFVENLNYSDAALRVVFPKYFDLEAAKEYARQPERIANRAYGNRMGNGNEASGDGYRFRGRGALQLTGRDNYQMFANSIGTPELMNTPDAVADAYAFDSALWFFKVNALWPLCADMDVASVTRLTKRINGGTNGLAHRIQLTRKYAGMLGLLFID
jgi:putative chitinase